MTPKEKAKELVSKMRRDNEMPYQYAKQCAVISVDEIIKEHYPPFIMSDERYNYWQEVKQEIQAL